MLEKYKLITEKYNDIIKTKENLAKYHTFKINGVADITITPNTIDEFVDIIKICKNEGYKFNIIGNGSNVLFRDDKYEGILVVTKNLNKFSIKEDTLYCQCGVTMPLIAIQSQKNGLTGFENLSGIPGTIGGAIKMNAGAYTSEIKDILVSATVLDRDYNILTLNGDELGLSYRKSNIKENEYIILSCKLKLQKGDKETIKQTMDELKAKRLKSQPLEYPNAGSIFKRKGDIFAGKLIDEAGLKGFSVGGAVVSEKHANFIINKEGATYKNIAELITYIQQLIYIENKVELDMEVEVL